MRELPIVFSGESVRAILDRLKTQTRRLMKPQPPSYSEYLRQWYGRPDAWLDQDGSDFSIRCPYAVGDRLWARETWREPTGAPQGWVDYQADDSREGFVWRSPLHMPRWASRLTLEVLRRWPQRLQDITPEECLAEGVAPSCDWKASGCTCWRDNFRVRWEKLNGKRSPWASNHWVWAVEFRVVEP